ncbi:sensor histidine kinase [Leucobacter iarius]|uniref:histidine kinase n=1 Tax=Leucobacter iarius TaxID=333963 RepID=A0ABP4XI70_9MICO
MPLDPPAQDTGERRSSAGPAGPPERGAGRRALALTGSILLVLLCAFFVFSSGGIHSGEDSILPPALRGYAMIGAFAMAGASLLLIWRRRWPVAIALGLIILTALVPTSPLPALVALPSAIAATTGLRRWGLVVGAYAATVISLAWDIGATTSLLSAFIRSPAAGTPERLALYWVMPAIAAFAIAPFVAVGVVRRLRLERDEARQGTAAAERSIAVLHQEVELERHRQELARELHDTLAARLSTLSLHAGALEMTVGETDERTTAAARAVRESAQGSLDDLRQVVRELRSPDLPESGRSSLAGLSALIDDAARHGTDVRAQLFVPDPESCDPRVAHAAFRLVQEAISNLRRHAPSSALHLEVRGGPETGLTLRTANWPEPGGGTPSTVGGGNGLLGMAERAELLGGVFQAGATTEGSFAMYCWLPWSPPTAPGSSAPLR